MAFEVGDTLVLYVARNNTLHIHEGVVSFNKHYYRNFVIFTDGRAHERVPNRDRIGKIQGGGPRLWLTERNDNLARKMFLDYETNKLEALERQVKRKKQLIEVLREGLEE